MQGLSLLELLVTFSIMAMSLAVLYRTNAATVRGVAAAEQADHAVALAQSLLATKDAVPRQGWNERGDAGSFQWQVQSARYATGVTHLAAPPMHQVEITVQWQVNGATKQTVLTTLRPEARVRPGASVP